jgi:aldose 1-epimerase
MATPTSRPARAGPGPRSPPSDGLAALHRLEEEVLVEALTVDGAVIITAAGSVVDSQRARGLLRDRATVVWLDAPVDELMSRMSGGAHRRRIDREHLEALSDQRRAHLAKVADLWLDARRPTGELVDEILTVLGRGSLAVRGRAQDFGRRRDGDRATLYTLGRGDGITAKVADHGATLVELHVPDRDGTFRDVVLGFDAVEGYESDRNAYFGATVGRVANRIAHGRFELGGRTYRLACNEPPHHLHGGAERSFDKVRWQVADRADDTLVLTYVSPDGEEGYPGRVEVTATYGVTRDTLVIEYRASADAPTPLDLTNHTYLNLRGEGEGSILDHELQVFADRALDVDNELIPTGRFVDLAGTPLDLRSPVVLGSRIRELGTTAALGWDHHYVLRCAAAELRPAARLHDPSSGRVLDLATDQPGLQVYSGNRLVPPVRGRHGHLYDRHSGVCLEAQHYPDAVHQRDFPSIVLPPGGTYQHTTHYRFSAT